MRTLLYRDMFENCVFFSTKETLFFAYKLEKGLLSEQGHRDFDGFCTDSLPFVITQSAIEFVRILHFFIPNNSNNMKACVLKQKGALEKSAFEVTTVPKPVPKDNEILVKIAATALNPVDWKVTCKTSST